MRKALRVLLTIFIFNLLLLEAFSQLGDVLWQEDFNSLDNWITETGNGSWGWGNGELQFYQADNVSISEIPGDDGNYGLKIEAREESGPNIIDQRGNPLSYTSGRLNTKSFISLKYGVIETRVWVPNIELGGWPAVWMLGTSNYSWPTKGGNPYQGHHQIEWDAKQHKAGIYLVKLTAGQQTTVQKCFLNY